MMIIRVQQQESRRTPTNGAVATTRIFLNVARVAGARSADGLAPKGRHERIASDDAANDLPKMLWPHGVRVHTRSSCWRGELAGEMGGRPADGEFLAWRPREHARAGTGAGDHVSMRRLRLSRVLRNARIAPAPTAGRRTILREALEDGRNGEKDDERSQG
jgi:hypothetical protein